MSWLGKTTKLLYFILFYFLFSWTYYTKRSMGKCYITSITSHSYITESYSIISHDGSHDKCGKVVHRLCSSCISNIGKFNGVSQTSFGHISINSPSILTVSMATESPWKDLSIGTSHVSRRSVMAEILGRSTSNHHSTVY